MPQRIYVQRSSALRGSCEVPGDKSISHRALMFGALAKGRSRVSHFLNGSDCLATAQVMRDLGVSIQVENAQTLIIDGKDLNGLAEAQNVLDCANSGTTIRLMSGLLAAQPFFSVLSGSEQIRRRPMARVIGPLQKMGADIRGREKGRLAPIAISPANLRGMSHKLEVASAQVKSALLLAGLFAEGTTEVIEPGPSRDHSERLLSAMGATLYSDAGRVAISQQQRSLLPFDMRVPGDPSSAAFLIAAALVCPSSSLILTQTSINSTRTGFLDAVKAMGAELHLEDKIEVCNEPTGNIAIGYRELKGKTFSGEIIVRMIDELPILAVVATQAHGETVIRDAKELKVKETNRIDTTVSELRKMGAHIEALDDGFVVKGPTQLRGAAVESHGDHRLAMAMTIAGLCAEGETVVEGAEVTVDSFPGFALMLQSLGAKVKEAT